ncbi:2'-5' RNA ligase family protein [Altericroceibacterium endophyticum]|uniref:2'-5' RNA ligase family protein n=1 Tax=Altericroceibacterium endophyticum TaxID=1808508 RepID=A0A6I4T3P4_9SPHN|nr:2'-5' RNA ligase family protein [Altericroceibacterium endophyticum]MXO64882.1 2'-5' RNA ligase family protein [Altericroceibacterium endophyticum]
MSAPFIVTAELPKDLASWATGLRREHFPPERNHLSAHVTLFHALPPSVEGELRDCFADIVAQCPPPAAVLEGIMSLGQGTALRITSPDMEEIRAEIAERFHGLLTPQDQAVPRLHVTIQNKVSAKEAKALQQSLEPLISKQNFRFRAIGLHIYRDGPWEFVRDWPFRG